jgi:hypothetical protein
MLRMGFAPCGERALSIWPPRESMEPWIPCGRASLWLPTLNCGGHRPATVPAVQRRTPIPAVHVLRGAKGPGSATTRRPPWPPLHCPVHFRGAAARAHRAPLPPRMCACLGRRNRSQPQPPRHHPRATGHATATPVWSAVKSWSTRRNCGCHRGPCLSLLSS